MEHKTITKTLVVDLELFMDKTTMEALTLVLNFISHISNDTWEIMLIPIIADLISMTYVNMKNDVQFPELKTLSGQEVIMYGIKALDELSLKLKLVLKEIKNE